MEKKKVLKIVGIIVAVFVLLNAVGTGVWFANYKGYFAAGNKSQYAVKNAGIVEDSPLAGKHIAFLGSSVTEACDQCGVCGIQYVVEADGGVYPCDFYMTDEYCIGNFNVDRLEGIDARRRDRLCGAFKEAVDGVS